MRYFIRFLRLFLTGRAEIKAECAESEGLVSALRSDWRWRKVRNDFVSRHPRCRMCETTTDIEVHHIIPWHVDENLRYAEHNLVTLCRPDHFRFGHWRNWRSQNSHIIELAEVTTEMRRRNETYTGS